MMQSMVVAVLVLGCAVYALWSLMPAAPRRALATALLKLPLPASFTGPLRRATRAASGCGCDGCDHAPSKAGKTARGGLPVSNLPNTPQPLTFHRRVRD